jgi:hypothetical protein
LILSQTLTNNEAMTSSSIADTSRDFTATKATAVARASECPDRIASIMFVITVVVCAAFIAMIIAHLF